MGCDQLHEIADELALDMLTGTERAAALHHLEHCEACRGVVASLAVTADLVLLSAPATPPPAGFESRVLGRIDGLDQRSRRRARRRPRVIRAALGAAAAVVVLLAALALTLMPDGRGPSVSATSMRTTDGTVVGSVELRHDDPAAVVVEVTDWEKTGAGGENPPYRLAVDRRDGTRQLVTLAVAPDYSWQLPVPGGETEEIVGVTLVDRDGSVLCSGRFD